MTGLRIAVAGAGTIGRAHMERIEASKQCELAAIVDPMPAAAEQARAAGVPFYSSLSELFAAQRPDGVILGTPNRAHMPGAMECVAAGVPALVEKPIADSVEDGSRLVDAAEAAGVPVQVGHHRRHSPLLKAARRVVDDGTLGPLVAVTGTAMFYKPDDYFETAPWRREPGGGPILINMIHEVDNLRSICGDIVAVQAFASNSTRGFPVEESALSWEQTSRETTHIPYPSYDEDCYLIAGINGSLGVPTMRLKTFPGKRSWWEPFDTSVVEVERTDPTANQLDHFCAVIRGEAEPMPSAREGLETLRVALAIADAARTGGVVSTERPAAVPK